MARRKDTEKPAQIIEAAFEVFGDIGFEGTLMKDIAERAGISSGTIYTYFQDKKDLFGPRCRKGGTGSSPRSGSSSIPTSPPSSACGGSSTSGSAASKTYLPLLRGMLFESSQMNLLQGQPRAALLFRRSAPLGARACRPPPRRPASP